MTRTVVFTDLENYTATVGRADRAALRDLIASHEQMVAPVLERHGGRVVKNLGDSFMALFEAATDALRACVELIETIPQAQGIGIRAGMATGDVELIDGDAFGDAVNLSSRILGKAPDGEVWFSAATQLCMNQTEIAWDLVGRYALKGIAGETEVYRAVPKMRTWLPANVEAAARAGRLVRIRRGDPTPPLPPQPVILLEEYPPGSDALGAVVDQLPVVDPACLWLVAYNIASSDRHQWTEAGHGLLIGTTGAVETALQEAARPQMMSTGSDTIILDMGARAVVELVMAGIALPTVPLSDVVAGYSYDLLADGRWVNRNERAVARVSVLPSGLHLTALNPGMMVGGRQCPVGTAIALDHDVDILVPSGTVSFRLLDDRSYVGYLASDTLARLGVAPGQQAEIGREPNHPGLALPDRRGQENIRWCVGSRSARARESGFTLDRALAGRRQCAVCMGPAGASVISLHDRCPTYVVEDQSLSLVSAPRPVLAGDVIVTGTSVIAIREPAS